ncbi:Hsp20/alpha crystallin family protein [Cellulomonas sp. P5_C6]
MWARCGQERRLDARGLVRTSVDKRPPNAGQRAWRDRYGRAEPHLYRAGDQYVLHMDLPGADPGTIDVNVEDRTLTIRAQRTGRPDEGVQWLAKERPVGTYARQLTVGRGLALDDISATYTDGVLTESIPVAEEAKPRRITVQHGSDAAEITAQADATA